MKIDKDKLCRLVDKAFNSQERQVAKIHWEEQAEFIIPNQSGLFTSDKNHNPGSKRTRRFYDSTAVQANSDIAAAIHATLTNPATKWSKIRFKNDILNNDEESVLWIENVNNKIHDYLNESNFNIQVSRSYPFFSALGNMILLHEQQELENSSFEGYRFTAIHLAEVAFSENKDGIVDIIYRKFELTARQAIEKWPDDVSEAIKEAVLDNPEKKFEFIHCVAPRDKEDIKFNDIGLADPKDRPYMSVYIEKKEKNIVQEGGYYEFPFYVVRWSTTPGEVYGRGPGSIAIADIRSLNRLKELSLQSLAKAVAPPMLAVQRGILGSLDLRPNGLTYVRDINGIKEMQTAARFDVESLRAEDLKNSIKQMFFLDKMLLPPRTETGEMTAFEVSQRVEQMNRVLGPTLSRLNSEFLTPLIVRCFRMLLRAGVLGPIPKLLQNSALDVEIVFVNQLARSQQIEDVTNIQGWVQELGLLAQLKPEVLDYINADGIAKHTSRVRGIPEVAVTNDDAVAQIRNQRQQQLQAAQQLDAAAKTADIATKAAPLIDKGE